MKIVVAAVLTAAFVASAASAQTSPSGSRDVRCMLVSTHFSRTVKDPKLAPLMSLASSFYLGRVDQSVPAGRLEAMMRSEAQSLVGTNPSQVAKECVTYMVGRAQTVQRIGQSLAGTVKSPAGQSR